MASPQSGKKIPKRITWSHQANTVKDSVSVQGSYDNFSNWTKLEPTLPGPDCTFACTLPLLPGSYHIRFLVNGAVDVDLNKEIVVINGAEYNKIVVSESPQQARHHIDSDPASEDNANHSRLSSSIDTAQSRSLQQARHHHIDHSISAPCSPRHNRRGQGRSSVPNSPPLYKRGRRGRQKKKKKAYNGPDIDAIREEVVKREQEWREAWILQERRHFQIRDHEKRKLREQFKNQRQKWLHKIQEFHKGSKELQQQVEHLKTKTEAVENSKQLAQSSWNKQKEQFEQEIKFHEADAKRKGEKNEKLIHEKDALYKEVISCKDLLEKQDDDHTLEVSKLTKSETISTKVLIATQKQLEDAQKNEELSQKQLEESEEKIRDLTEQLNMKKQLEETLEEAKIELANRDKILAKKNEEDKTAYMISKRAKETIKKLENEIEILKQGQERKVENNAMVEAIQQELGTANDAVSSLRDELQRQKENATNIEKKLLDDKKVIEKIQDEKEKKLNLQLEEEIKIKNSFCEQLAESKRTLGEMNAFNESLSSKLEELQKESQKTQLDNKSHSQELSNHVEKLKNENKNLKHKHDQEISEMEKKHHRKISEMQSSINKASSEVEEALSQQKLKLVAWDRQKKELERQLQHHISKGDHLYSKLSSLQEHTKILRGVLSRLKDEQLNSTALFTRVLQEARKSLTRRFSLQTKLLRTTMQKYKRELSARRKYFNMVQELRGNIRVFCRVRPMLPSEKKNKDQHDAISFSVEEEKGQERSLLLKTKIKSHHAETKTCPFEFDRIFSPRASQEDVFSDTKFLIQSVMDGYNVCIFAYGQTGSGKTYTIEGSPSNPGVNTRALKELFRIKQERAPEYAYKIKISMLEIYNEQIRDLLADQKANPWDEMIQPKIRKSARGMFVDGLTEWPVKCLEDVNKGITKGKSNRSTGVTNMNEHSSRSHMLLSVQVTGRNSVAGINHFGKLHLIDLAGSERLSRSQAKGDRLKEAQSINKSLAALGNVIEALQKKSSHVPYRNSKLTYMLQDSLGGHAKTLMFINVSPASLDADETNCSLTFATRVRQVELGKSTKNTTYDKPLVVRSKSNKNNEKINTVTSKTPRIQKTATAYFKTNEKTNASNKRLQRNQF